MLTSKQHVAAMTELIGSIQYWSPRETFTDFVEMAAIAHRNAFDQTGKADRESRYQNLIQKYKPADQGLFGKLHGMLVQALTDQRADILGQLYMELGASNAERGQYFTPPAISNLLAGLTIDTDQIHHQIARRGFVTLSEPASGSGAMIIGFANKMLDLKINYQQHLHVTLVDLDIRAVHMAYVQLSLLHVPAIVVHGNTLTVEEYSHWVTAAHHIGMFSRKLKRGFAIDSEMGAVYCGEGSAESSDTTGMRVVARANQPNTAHQHATAL